MHSLLVLLLVAGAIALLLASFWRKPPRIPPQARLPLALLAAVVALLVLVVLAGRLSPLLALLVAAVPVLVRLLAAKQVFDRLRPNRGPSPGQRSRVSTRFLDMSLDHDTGEMDGVVREGRFQGRSLSELELAQLLELLAECRAQDQHSAQVLEAWLDREHGDAWREQDPGSGADPGAAAPDTGRMTVREAREILGVGESATRDDIVGAHRRLMQRLHPDRGGSTYLAAKVNEAKELLLASL